jgi:hypothetical protein
VDETAGTNDACKTGHAYVIESGRQRFPPIPL